MAAAPLSYPDLAFDKFSGDDPGQDINTFLQIVENKINFSLGSRPPTDANQQAQFDFRQKALLASLLRGSAATWYEQNEALAWTELKAQLKLRFTDGRDKYQYRLEAENCTRHPTELIKNYIARVRKTVDKGWPIDLTGVATADQATATTAQNARREQKYIDIITKGLVPQKLRRIAYEYVPEHPNATCDAFTNHLMTHN